MLPFHILRVICALVGLMFAVHAANESSSLSGWSVGSYIQGAGQEYALETGHISTTRNRSSLEAFYMPTIGHKSPFEATDSSLEAFDNPPKTVNMSTIGSEAHGASKASNTADHHHELSSFAKTTGLEVKDNCLGTMVTDIPNDQDNLSSLTTGGAKDPSQGDNTEYIASHGDESILSGTASVSSLKASFVKLVAHTPSVRSTTVLASRGTVSSNATAANHPPVTRGTKVNNITNVSNSPIFRDPEFSTLPYTRLETEQILRPSLRLPFPSNMTATASPSNSRGLVTPSQAVVQTLVTVIKQREVSIDDVTLAEDSTSTSYVGAPIFTSSTSVETSTWPSVPTSIPDVDVKLVKSGALPRSSMIGISIGIGFGVLLVAGLICFFVVRRNHQRRQAYLQWRRQAIRLQDLEPASGPEPAPAPASPPRTPPTRVSGPNQVGESPKTPDHPGRASHWVEPEEIPGLNQEMWSQDHEQPDHLPSARRPFVIDRRTVVEDPFA